MTETKAREYHDLELESSNELLEHDSRLLLGRYEEAAYHALQAGRCRARMGQLCFEAEEYAEATEDWLSAAACFLLATAREQAAGVLDVLHHQVEGKIPAERPDLREAVRQRDQELKDLNQRVQQFLRSFGLGGYQVDVAEERTLGFLRQQVRDLPGLPLLHYAIFRQASDLGQRDLAAEHLVWAATFDPENANLVALLGYLHLGCGKPDRAVSLADDYLAAHSSDAGPVRIMLANALASGSSGRPPDQEKALAVLRPLVESPAADIRARIAALALSATLQYELGREQEFDRLVKELDRLEGSLQAPDLRDAISAFRRLIPSPGMDGTGNIPATEPRPLPEGVRFQLFQKAKEVSVRPLSLAA
jgi:hypothetical protein